MTAFWIHARHAIPNSRSISFSSLYDRRRLLNSISMLIGSACLLLAFLSVPLHAQTIEDGIMVHKANLFTGPVYTYSYWNKYWEGTRQRTNENIGTVITQSATWYADYGLTNRWNVIASVPYVWTRATQGVLHGMSGFQDITLAAKYDFYHHSFSDVGDLRFIGVVAGSLPLSGYTPDFQPLSIGFDSKQISTRLTVNFQTRPGWFVNGSAAYTWRGDVTLDRPYYFTENQLFMINQVAMPNVFNGIVNAGYLKNGLMAQVTFARQNMDGGGDIRRQDAPFVSNRVNYSNVGGMVMYSLPILNPRSLAFKFQFDYTVDGRNVGQAKTFTSGLFYTFNFSGKGPTQ